MKHYTVGHIKYMLMKPVFSTLIHTGIQPHQILSAMHHMGAG